VIGLWGPRARDVLEAVTPDDVSNAAFPFMAARSIGIGGTPVLAQRITYVGELGWELYLDPVWAVQVWDRLMAAGQPHGIAPGGYRVLDSLRIEKAYRYFGTDITPSDTPYDASLGFCVELEKGEFIGRDALVLARDDRTRSRIRTVVVGDEGYVTIYGGEAVHAEGRVVARLRSCAYGHTLRRNVAFAYLPPEMDSGAQVLVEVFGQLVPASVTNDVLYDPERRRVAA